MPLEEHYRRVNTPLRKLTLRERRVLVWGPLLTGLAILILVIATVGHGPPPPGPGCIRVTVPGRTGGEVVSGCGAQARVACRRARGFEGRRAEEVLEACAEAGIRF